MKPFTACHIHGPTLGLLLSSVTSAGSDCDGILFGEPLLLHEGISGGKNMFISSFLHAIVAGHVRSMEHQVYRDAESSTCQPLATCLILLLQKEKN